VTHWISRKYFRDIVRGVSYLHSDGIRFDQVTPLVANLSIACMKVIAQMVNQSIHALARAARRCEVAI
jgi:hypothetical protein